LNAPRQRDTVLQVKANPKVQQVAILLVIAAFVGLFGSLLWETWEASSEIEVDGIQAAATPLLAGALGLLLALALGVEPKMRDARSWKERLRALVTINALLTLGAVVYMLAAVAGGIVWWKKGDITPDMVSTLVLAAIGYAVAAIAVLSRS
jgi:hypothetical protein